MTDAHMTLLGYEASAIDYVSNRSQPAKSRPAAKVMALKVLPTPGEPISKSAPLENPFHELVRTDQLSRKSNPRSKRKLSSIMFQKCRRN